MTPKEREAMQQALEALEELFHSNSTNVAVGKYNIAHNALREALDHSGESTEMVVGWDRAKPEAIASDPLYQQGFVDGVEEGRNQVAEQAEQEPVAFQAREIGEGDWFDVGLDEVTRITGIINSPHIDYRWLYAAPIRTKDLTDDEIEKAVENIIFDDNFDINIARAVIAADREKNRV